MRELTYSHGLIIDDARLATALAIFCGKVWLPYSRVGDAVGSALKDAGLPATQLKHDPTREGVERWGDTHEDLFAEQVFERLPGPSTVNHAAHRHDFDDRSVKEIIGIDKPLYERLALRFHFTRGDLPGIEMFDAGTSDSEIDLAQSVLFWNLPKLSVEPKKILDLRHDAQKHGLADFWEMMENEARHAEKQGQTTDARAEKIRNDFTQWMRGRRWVAAYSGSLGLITTLAMYVWVSQGLAAPATGILAGAAASSVPSWFGELNGHRVAYRRAEQNAFQCISRIDRALRRA